MNVEVRDDAEEDLAAGFVFYEQQQPGVGRYFFAASGSTLTRCA